MLQGREAAFRFFCWIDRILPGVNGLFRLTLKDRDEEKALYDSPMPLWTPVMGLLGRRTSRNKMDADRNDPSYVANVMALARQTDWVDGEAIHYCDYSEAEFETVYMNHAYEGAYLPTS